MDSVGSMVGDRIHLNKKILGRVRDIKADLEALAERHGMTVEDLCRIPAADENALFISPDGQTWSGKGRKPSWLKQAEAEGRNVMDFRVSGERAGDEDIGESHQGV